jgi:Flp pilus assembly protein TadG
MSHELGLSGRLTRCARRLRDHEGGAAALEFALVFPLVVVMLFGIVEFGRAWQRNQVITDAAREGARWAVVRDGQNKANTVPAVVQDRLTAASLWWDGTLTGYAASCEDWEAPAPSEEEVVVSGCGWGSDTGTEARVTIGAPYPFTFLRPLLKLLSGSGSIDVAVLSTNFVMRNE